YQEQVMRIASALAGYSLAEADVLRKAVGKKIKELIQEELGNFVKRAIQRGHDKKTVEEIAAQIETFGRYGFNKSHSVAYSILSYQTAWFKVYYPAEFMAALLSSEIGNTDRVAQSVNRNGSPVNTHSSARRPSSRLLAPGSRTYPPGPSTSAWYGKKRCSASSSPGTPSPSTARKWSFLGRGRRRPWGCGVLRR